MPRRKTIQPDPLQLIVTDELIIEIRDWARRAIGRGEIEKYQSIDFQMRFLDWLIDQTVQVGFRNRVQLIDLLEGPRKVAALARQISVWDGGHYSDQTYRRHAIKVRQHWSAFRQAGAKLDIER
jgi:hypothetical protein